MCKLIGLSSGAREIKSFRQEELEAEWKMNMAIWEASRQKRRQHDMEVPQKGRLNVALLCHQVEDFHWEFFGQFFCKEYCGWDIQFDSIWNGYEFPEKADEISNLLFSTTGTIFEPEDGKKGAKIPEWNYVLTYGFFVCGYPLNSENHLSPNDYRRAVHGLNAWLAREKGKRDGDIVEYGSFDYWTQLFRGVAMAVFGDELNKEQCTDAPRNIFHLVAARWNQEERLPFPELKDEKTFRTFLHACCEGGEHHEKASHYFHVKVVKHAGTEKLRLTFNPECLPAPELTPEEDEALVDHVFEMGKKLGVLNVKEPPKENLVTRLQREFEINAKKHAENDYCFDDNARAETECESQD